MNYPGVGHPNTTAVHRGVILRKKKYKKFFEEGYYVVTPSGHMFQFKSASLTINPTPELSIFLPKCTLGAPTSDNSRFHQFSILIDKKNTFNLEPVYTFKAKSHRELMEWWNILKDFCKLCSASPLSIMTRNGRTSIAARDMGCADRKKDSEGDYIPPSHSDPLTHGPPQPTSSMQLSHGDRQEIPEGHSQRMQQYRPADTRLATTDDNAERTSDVLDDELRQSASLARPSYDDRRRSFEADNIHQHQYELHHYEVETDSEGLTHECSQSTSVMRLELNTALERAYQTERCIPQMMINGRPNLSQMPLVNQSPLAFPPVSPNKNEPPRSPAQVARSLLRRPRARHSI